jgi:hypothetical protein
MDAYRNQGWDILPSYPSKPINNQVTVRVVPNESGAEPSCRSRFDCAEATINLLDSA